MKTIINLSSDSNVISSPKDLKLIKTECIVKILEKDIKSIIKTLQSNYEKFHNEEKNELSVSDTLLSLLPYRTVIFPNTGKRMSNMF